MGLMRSSTAPLPFSYVRELGSAADNGSQEDEVRVLPLDAGLTSTNTSNGGDVDADPPSLRAQPASSDEEGVLPTATTVCVILSVALSMLVVIGVFAFRSRSDWFKPKVPFKWVAEPVEPDQMPKLAVRVWLPSSSKRAVHPSKADISLGANRAAHGPGGAKPGVRTRPRPEAWLPTPPEILPPLMPQIVRGRQPSKLEPRGSQPCDEAEHGTTTVEQFMSEISDRPDSGNSKPSPHHLKQRKAVAPRANSEPRYGFSVPGAQQHWERSSVQWRSCSQPLQGDNGCRPNSLSRSRVALSSRLVDCGSSSAHNLHRPRPASPLSLPSQP